MRPRALPPVPWDTRSVQDSGRLQPEPPAAGPRPLPAGSLPSEGAGEALEAFSYFNNHKYGCKCDFSHPLAYDMGASGAM